MFRARTQAAMEHTIISRKMVGMVVRTLFFRPTRNCSFSVMTRM